MGKLQDPLLHVLVFTKAQGPAALADGSGEGAVEHKLPVAINFLQSALAWLQRLWQPQSSWDLQAQGHIDSMFKIHGNQQLRYQECS